MVHDAMLIENEIMSAAITIVHMNCRALIPFVVMSLFTAVYAVRASDALGRVRGVSPFVEEPVTGPRGEREVLFHE